MLKDIILRIRTEFVAENTPPRCGEAPLLSETEEDQVLDQVLGPPPEEEDGDVLELTTEAVWSDDGKGIVIGYEESELSGMEGTTTVIAFSKAEPTLVTVSREGTYTSTLILEQGKSHTGQYHTPVMPLEVTTRTHRLLNRLLEDGTLEADYTVRIGTITTSRSRLHIQVREE